MTTYAKTANRSRFAVAVPAALALVLGACAGLPVGTADREETEEVLAVADPLEPVNRQFFAINAALDTFLLRPAAVLYRDWMPEFGKRVVGNVVGNLRLPTTFLNEVAQGEFARAGTTFMRFLVNSTVGVGGIADVASGQGLEPHREDFGQTLGVYGVQEPVYLVLPVLGPSGLRDVAGLTVDAMTDPVNIGTRLLGVRNVGFVRAGAGAMHARYRALGTVDTLRRGSLDPYALIRNLYRQRRMAQIANGDRPEGVRPPTYRTPHPGFSSGVPLAVPAAEGIGLTR